MRNIIGLEQIEQRQLAALETLKLQLRDEKNKAVLTTVKLDEIDVNLRPKQELLEQKLKESAMLQGLNTSSENFRQNF